MKLLISLLLSIPLISCPKDDLLIGEWESGYKNENKEQLIMKFSNDSVWVTNTYLNKTSFKIDRNYTEDLDLYFVVPKRSLEMKVYYKFKNKNLLFLDSIPIKDFTLRGVKEKFKRVK